ncbi:MAG: prenyltransferase/squalene oxidase repeat-containing protein [Gemmatimonadota bacterium]
MIRQIVRDVKRRRAWSALPREAREEVRHDREVGLSADPGSQWAIDRATEWLLRAQECSSSQDGGMARHYSLVDGWGPSYPETTGYIAPTLFHEADRRRDRHIENAGRRLLDWLVSIQMESGAFQGGVVGASPVVPVTFNTGQILLGLAAGAARFGDPYRKSMRRAADWLVTNQDPDGCWRGHPTPFAARGEKTYETHVSWGLFEAARVDPARGYAEAALRQVRWAVGHQQENGWFELCCLDQPHAPLTHTIGYAFRGVIEAYRFTGERDLLIAALRTADGVMAAQRADGSLAGRLDGEWREAVDWVCLTGVVQIAIGWLLLWQEIGDENYRKAAEAANRFVRRTLRADVPQDRKGGVKGSFPVDGEYGQFEYLAWASKFLIDALRVEQHMDQVAALAAEPPLAVRAERAAVLRAG